MKLLHRLHRRWEHLGSRLLVWVGFSSAGVRVTGLVIGVLASFLLVRTRALVPFGTMLLVGSLFLTLHDEVALRTDKVTDSGRYLDSMCNRLFEAMVFLAAGWVSGHWPLCFLCMVGGFVASYAKARTALEIPISDEGWPEVVSHGARSMSASIGLILWGVLPELQLAGRDLLYWVLLALSVAVAVTVGQRIFYARERLQAAEVERVVAETARR